MVKRKHLMHYVQIGFIFLVILPLIFLPALVLLALAGIGWCLDQLFDFEEDDETNETHSGY